jgi:hypothetical protein
MMLSVDWLRDGRRKLITKLSRRNIPARILVNLLRKSAVRRTPKTVPICAPPKVPARPPPLLDCINTTIIRSKLTINSTAIRNPNIKAPVLDQGNGILELIKLNLAKVLTKINCRRRH